MLEPRTSTVRRHRSDEELVTTVTKAIADTHDIDPLDLPPLPGDIDFDGLERLVRPGGDTGYTDLKVEFNALGCEVTVFDHVTVTVQQSPIPVGAERASVESE